MAKPRFLVPFKDGSIMHYAEDRVYEFGGSYYKADEWREPEEFTATLTIDHTVSGRSAKYFIWKDADGRAFPMFATDLVGLVQKARVNLGTVSGVWIPCKRGANFGIRYLRAC